MRNQPRLFQGGSLRPTRPRRVPPGRGRRDLPQQHLVPNGHGEHADARARARVRSLPKQKHELVGPEAARVLGDSRVESERGLPLGARPDTGSHTTPSARWTPILKDFCRLLSPPTPRFQSPSSTPAPPSTADGLSSLSLSLSLSLSPRDAARRATGRLTDRRIEPDRTPRPTRRR